jgi:uncharacterized protein YfaS (alpha-2-macroglobulin family)
MSFYPNETVSKSITFRDKDNALLDPDTTTVDIIDPNNTTIANPSLSQISTGIYEMNYNIPLDATLGQWKVVITANKGTYRSIALGYFSVEPL